MARTGKAQSNSSCCLLPPLSLPPGKERPSRNKSEKERGRFVEIRTMLTIFAAGATVGHDGVLENDVYFGGKEKLSVKLGWRFGDVRRDPFSHIIRSSLSG